MAVSEKKRRIRTLALKINRCVVSFRVCENREIMTNTTLDKGGRDSTQSVQAKADINFELLSSRTGTSGRSSFASFGDNGSDISDNIIVRYRAVLPTGATSLIRSGNLTKELVRASVKNRD